MKTRLLVFAAALLLLPLAGFLLGGREWDELARPQAQDRTAETALLVLLGYTILLDLLVKLRTGNRLLVTQRGYFLAVAAGGAAMCWLLAYLNGFAAGWPSLPLRQIALDTLLFALLAPAVLITRALLGTFPGLLKRLARGPALSMPNGETAALIFASLAAFSLLGGGALSASWLLLPAPMLLLLALQLLWHESTIFDVLREGDWGRLVCASLSGLIVGNLVALGDLFSGNVPQADLHGGFAQFGYALFGLLCLQLGDVVAEDWRGKTRAQVFKKKPFPIPVVKK